MPLGLDPPTTLSAACGLMLLALLYVVRMVYTGKLIPRFHVDKLEQDRDHWRATAEALVPALKDVVDQQHEVLVGMRLVEAVVRNLQRKADEE